MRLTPFRVLLLTVAALLAAMPAAAATDAILAGSDFWHTPADGRTYAQFATNPIPADFFCPGSAPFTGRIEFKGEPLATDPPDALGNADTAVERLDDAVFDDRGIAHSRVRIRALSMVSIEPLRTSCGLFHVRVSLDGEQAVSPLMTIVRERPDSGIWETAFDIRYKMSFSADRSSPPRILTGSGFIRSNPDHFWWTEPGRTRVVAGSIRIDTDGDRVPDSAVPGNSNFFGNGGSGRFGLGGDGPELSMGDHSYTKPE